MQAVFKRYESKYLINKEQYARLLSIIKEKMKPDKYGLSTICNIYYDTDSFLLIRNSIEKPLYKEKLRLRNYNLSNQYFLELKKKYKSVVYKRRIALDKEDMNDFLSNLKPTNQIQREIVYFYEFYENIKEKMFISYKREAYYGENELRITFDTNLLYRNYDLNLEKGPYGKEIIPNDQILMEIKALNAMPLWLTNFLTNERIFKTSFSKYGRAYLSMMKGDEIYV